MLKGLLRNLFDYDIIGEYLDLQKDGHYHKKYIKKWHLRKKR